MKRRDSEPEMVRRWLDDGAPPEGRVEVLLRRGDAAGAAAAAESLLVREPGDLKALCLAALARMSTGELPAAQGLFERALKLHPRSAMAWGLKGFLLDRRVDAKTARKSLDRAVRLSPAAGWPLAMRSQWFRAHRDLDACLKDLDGALRREKQAWIHRLRAECLEQLGRMEAAVAELDAALALAPGNAALHELRGHCLFHRKDYAAAEAAFTGGLRLESRNVRLLQRRSNCRWLSGDADGAVADLKRCRSLEPASADHRLSLARLAILSGRDRGVLPELVRLERSGLPGSVAAASQLEGMLHFRRRRYAKSAAAFARAESLAREGHYPGRFSDVGWSQLARGFDYMKRHETRKEAVTKPVLILAGLGLDYPRQATLESLKALAECDLIVNNLAGSEAMEFLGLFCKDVRTISFEGLHSDAWADKIFKWLKPGVKAAFVTRGHPLVSGHLALTLLKRAAGEGVEVRCYGALSSVDQALALTQEVLSETWWGMQVADAGLVLAGKLAPQTGLPLILYLSTPKDAAEHRRMAKTLGGLLTEAYGAGHEAKVFGPRYDSRTLETVAAGKLEEFLSKAERRMVSSLILLLPPLVSLSPVNERERRGLAPAVDY